VLDWLNGREHKLLPPERMRPHCSISTGESLSAFMHINNIPPTLADAFWREGIEPLRIDRRRAGARLRKPASTCGRPSWWAGERPADVKEGIARCEDAAMRSRGVLSIRRQGQVEPSRMPDATHAISISQLAAKGLAVAVLDAVEARDAN